MIHAIWKWLQLLLPYGLILHIYRHDKGLPANIKMQNGRCLKAIMITTDYGLLFSQEKYVDNRLKRLVDYMLEGYELVFDEYTVDEVESSYLDIELDETEKYYFKIELAKSL